MHWFRKREKVLFRTHEAPFRRPEWAVGRIIDHEGRLWRVTKWVELRPVLLERGGSVRQWELWGRRLSDQELRDEMAKAADKLLASEEGPPED